MADFAIAQKFTGHIEGGYVNDPNDSGGETVFGLTRRDWPHWNGWPVIDHLKAQFGLAKAIQIINTNVQLKDSAVALFKTNYWDVNSLTQINDQQLADQVYDADINMGVGTGARMLQQAAGVDVDLHIGPKTIAAINNADPQVIYNKFIAIRKARYEQIIASNPKNERYRASWFSRMPSYKTSNLA